jgi:hypothetical protein
MKFSFSLKDLFWLVLVLALAAGWFFQHQSTTGRYQMSPFPGNSGAIIIFDTQTGKSWVNGVGGKFNPT